MEYKIYYCCERVDSVAYKVTRCMDYCGILVELAVDEQLEAGGFGWPTPIHTTTTWFAGNEEGLNSLLDELNKGIFDEALK